MAEVKDNKRKNGKLSLYPLKFEKAVRAVLEVKPPQKSTPNKESSHD
jgi:hypothetical protein